QMRVGSPDLRTVHQVVVAAVFGARAHAGEIGAGAGLRIALAPTNLTARHFRQVLALLHLCTELEQYRTKHRDAKTAQRRPRFDRSQRLLYRPVALVPESAAAVPLRPGRAHPAALDHPLEPEASIRVVKRLAAAAPDDLRLRRRPPQRGRAVRLQPSRGLPC